MRFRRSLAALVAAVSLGCGPDATGVAAEHPIDEIRAIHITMRGEAVGPVIHAGAFGGYPFDVVLEDGAGVRHPRQGQRVTWGSTHPAVVDGGDAPGATFLFFLRDGTANVIAHLDGLRDTVTIHVAQVAVMARMTIDTVVALAPGARDVTGAGTSYHGLRFAVIRRDSNFHRASSEDPFYFESGDDAPFDVLREPRDTITILGNRTGTGSLVIEFLDTADTVAVQVTDRYAVMRLKETASAATFYTLPDTVRIPVGAAVIFQNETRGFVDFEGIDGVIDPAQQSGQGQPFVDGVRQTGARQWAVGPIPPNGREAQRFGGAGTFEFWWAGSPRTVIVTP